MATIHPPTPQQALMTLFANEASALVWSADSRLQIDRLAGGILAALGIDDSEAAEGRPVATVFEQQEDPQAALIAAHKSALGGELTPCQFQWRGWLFQGRVLPNVDHGGEIIGCLGIAYPNPAIDGLEEALDASEQRFETLVGMSPAGIYMTDESGRCTYVNQRWCEMTDLSAVDALGYSWLQVIHPEDRDHVARCWEQAVESKIDWEQTYRLIAPHAEETWVLDQAKPLRGIEGQPTGYVGIVIDITQRKRANQQLRESERRFARLLKAVTSYRYCVLLDNGIPVATEHSAGCAGTTGYLPEDYARDPYLWINMVHPEDRELVRTHIGKVLSGQSAPPIEHRIYHKNGSIVWVRATIIPHVASDGELVRYDGLVEDITDRKRVERRLGQILESAPDAMVITDQSGTIQLVNGQTQQLFGYTSQELFNQPVETLVPERFRSAHVAHRTAFHATPDSRDRTQCDEIHGLRKDGSEFAAEISLSPIEMDDEVLVCAGIRDVSQRKQIEQAMRVNLQLQLTLASLLKLSLESIDLEEKMTRSLNLLLAVPWIGQESKGAIFLLLEGSDELTPVAQRGLNTAPVNQCQHSRPGGCLCSRVSKNSQAVIAKHFQGCQTARHSQECGHGHYCIPILSSGTPLGVLTIFVKSAQDENTDAKEQFLQAVAHVLAGIITRCRGEELLRSSEERFGLAVRGTDAGIWDWNLLTNQVYFSPHWKSMLGFDADEIGDDLSAWEQRIHPDDRERAGATITAYLRGETKQYELEHRMQHRDGTYRWILARGAMVRNDDGHPCRMVGSHLDITDRKLAETQLRHREAQLVAAQKIQEHLLPRHAPELPGFEIAGHVVPAHFAGGDHFDYMPLADGTMAIIVADVSGHDVSAALVMASTSAHLRSFAEEHSSVQDIVEHTNSLLAREMDDGLFVTMFVLQLDSVHRSVRYANAGHPTGYVLNADGQMKASLRSMSLPLAVLPDADFPVSAPLQLDSGDMVLLITDGILEAHGPEGTCFGEERLIDIVRKHQNRPPAAIIDAIEQAVFHFIALPHAQDDLTMVILKAK